MKFRLLSRFEYGLYIAIVAIGIALDQLTKWLAVRFLMPIDTFPIIKNVLHLTYAENRGAAFGMLANDRWIFLIVSTVAILAMVFYLFSGLSEGRLAGIALAMLISGGIGNMIDRLLMGYVVDFIDFRLIHFAIFNGADTFVCVGAGLLILALIFDMIDERKERR
ncbi:MAG: signal peptidase II [Clostridia bacterium]|nr:signal peptidase II [Clostridia bacterium]